MAETNATEDEMTTREAIFQSEGRAALSRGFLVVGDAVASVGVQVVGSAPATALAQSYVVTDHALATTALDAGIQQVQANVVASTGTVIAVRRILAPPTDPRDVVALFRCVKGQASGTDRLRAAGLLERAVVRRAPSRTAQSLASRRTKS